MKRTLKSYSVYILWDDTSFRVGFQVWVSDWFLIGNEKDPGWLCIFISQL